MIQYLPTTQDRTTNPAAHCRTSPDVVAIFDKKEEMAVKSASELTVICVAAKREEIKQTRA